MSKYAPPPLTAETVLDCARQLDLPVISLDEAERIAAGAAAAVSAVRVAASGAWDDAEPADFERALQDLAVHE